MTLGHITSLASASSSGEWDNRRTSLTGQFTRQSMKKLARGTLPHVAILLLGSMLSGGLASYLHPLYGPFLGKEGEAYSCMISEPINQSFCLGGYKL